ncbi:Rgg/GadR/MutR family transcriptional regulator [Lactococcus formosensis]|jgi:Rgg/GadR/MutR family transcriptional activator|nr:Rgg/GadR/MutR family transcriptional regulator [Lactococcus formosensis]MCH1722126.1 helix-turn-helix domain-containing protein [Lactococcus formosensis]MDG6113851.1 helix-turn-helix domain-containing protein [Lactococcus formosensis]MDG6115832.1 helix-turn-helix domain-containing protein [Lactococcus formosensis]MDG6122158.1 helix-turn-helix domain-containing protein [Lactococcus formosensis]MDG6123681.1 helix-turn-helix domain-containing protein [Lactococcus formosensis]
MCQNRYGELFRKIRKQSGLSLTAFTSIGIGKTTLSDFERGKTMMRFDKVVMGLQFMGVSLEEFEHLLNHYLISDPLVILNSAESALIFENKEELRCLAELAKKSNHTQIHFALKILLGEAGDFEREELTEFLYTATSWTYKEMFIFHTLIDQIPPRDTLNILKEFKKSFRGIYRSTEYRRGLALVLFRAITVLSYYGYKKEAGEIILSIEEHQLAYSMFLRNLFYGTKAYWVYCFEDKGKGQEMAQKFMTIQELAGVPEVTAFYKKRVEQYMLVQE